MQILIDSGSYHCLNVGDVAMMQAAIERLRGLWPTASIAVVTNSPEALALHCPGVTPIPLAGRIAFQTDRWLGRGEQLLPRRLGAAFAVAHDRFRRRWPAVLAAIIAAKRLVALRSDYRAAPTYVRAVKRADLVVATGAGVFTDAFIANASGVLDTLDFALQHGVPAVAFGQGIGPVSNPALRQRMSEVLPRLDLIALRERRESIGILEAIGVEADRIVVTGDDAIETAARTARPDLGDAIGINIRLTAYAGLDASAVDAIGPAVRRAASQLAAPLVAVPIAHHSDCHDGAAIRRLIAADASTPIVDLGTPSKAIAEVSRCRVVVTGSYHAAVFALAQGIPVVAIAATQYYVDKFSGLIDLFGGGCEVVVVGSPSSPALDTAIVAAWNQAPIWREPLRKAATVQIQRGQEAYRLLRHIVSRRGHGAEPEQEVNGPLPSRLEV